MRNCLAISGQPGVRHAALVLPAPRVERPRLDHERTRVYRIDRTGAWFVIPGDAAEAELASHAMQSAQAMLAEVAGRPEFTERARRHAESVLKAFFRNVGWSLQVRWADRPSPH